MQIRKNKKVLKLKFNIYETLSIKIKIKEVEITTSTIFMKIVLFEFKFTLNLIKIHFKLQKFYYYLKNNQFLLI